MAIPLAVSVVLSILTVSVLLLSSESVITYRICRWVHSVRLSVRPSVRLSATLLGCLVCVICNSNSFHSFIFKLLHNDFLYIEDVHLLFCAHLINIFSFFTGVELRHFFHLKWVGGVWFV